MILAALAFGSTHGSELFVVGFLNGRSAQINPTALFPIAVVELAQVITFVFVGGALAVLPSFFVINQAKDNIHRLWVCIVFGVCMGILFLPLCASFPFLLSHEPEDPSYFARCLEFGLPMVIAGALGGYVFWRCARRTGASGELVADHFS